MTIEFTVSPDFPPDAIAGWYVLNTFLQRSLGEAIHLELYDDFDSQRAAIVADEVDLIYANPFDAAVLVREHGFHGVARPEGLADEAVLVVPDDAPATDVADLREGARIAHTDDPAVFMIGLMMLEPAELDRSNTEIDEYGSYALVAKALLTANADVGIFYADAFDGLANITRKRLRPLVRSRIDVIHHMMMVGPRLGERSDELQAILTGMDAAADEKKIVEGLGFERWLPVATEETEFMIDLIDTMMLD